MVVILHNKKVFHITNQTTKTIWNTLFKYPCIDVLSPLLASSELKEFSDFTKELHNRLVCLIIIHKYLYNCITFYQYNFLINLVYYRLKHF